MKFCAEEISRLILRINKRLVSVINHYVATITPTDCHNYYVNMYVKLQVNYNIIDESTYVYFYYY